MNNLLEGIRVLDFSQNAAGPTATAMLADYGAEVVKIERPVIGNTQRTFGMQCDNGVSLLGAWLDRGKKSVEMDLKDPQAIELIKRMVKDFDVVAESNRPGVMDRLGLGYEELRKINPKLVYLSVSMYGQKGPYGKEPGWDVMAQAMSGLMDITGEKNGPPMKHGTTLSDYVAGISAFGHILAALRYAEKTGIGQQIDVSLFMTDIYLNGSIGYLNVGINPTRSGNHQATVTPYGVFEGKNGQNVVMAAATDKLWCGLCDVMERPDLKTDPRSDTLNHRRENSEWVIKTIEDWLKTYDDIRVPMKMMEAAGLACCKVMNSEEVIADPQVQYNHYLTEIPVPDNVTSRKTYLERNCAAIFSETPGTVKKAPTVGENNVEVLERYMSDEEIKESLARWRKK